MASSQPPLPKNFTDLTKASKLPATQQFNVIGVCVSYLEPIKSQKGQQDWKCSLTLHDPEWADGEGWEFAFFEKDQHCLPVINRGDVVLLRNFRTMDRYGVTQGISNSASTWVVLPYTEVANISSVADLRDKARWQKKGQPGNNQYPSGAKAALPNEAELKYAKWIAAQEDPRLWPPMPARTQAEMSSVVVSSGGTPPRRKEKFRMLRDLERPNGTTHTFVELSGEVRRIYSNDFLTELYVTDYTTCEFLYDYQSHERQSGRTGDPFGYNKEDSGTWPGPWGQMTILIRCRDGQRDLANRKVKVGDFVYLRNIHIKMDKNGSKLEGDCRDDLKHPTKELIEVLKTKTERRDEVLRRKRTYEEKAEVDGIKFFRDPNQAPRKRLRDDPAEDQVSEPKSKRSKNRTRKDKKAAKIEQEEQGKARAAVLARQERALASNPSIRIHNHQGLLSKTVAEILDPGVLARKTAKGNRFQLPFQNCTYKSKVRVVDFFPDNIADFAAPRKIGQYDSLSDNESSGNDSDVDLSQEWREGELEWGWRFFLLVEDARPQPGGQAWPAQMELLVADQDGDCLFNMEACNLRDRKNERELALLREKLFHLWGDLQEKKEESNGSEESTRAKQSARPFECLIKEYGVPVRGQARSSGNVVLYDRLFRLFGTTI